MNELNMLSAKELAEIYLSKGFKVMPMPKRTTHPLEKGWNELNITLEDIPKWFNNGANIGLHLKGEESKWLTDVDIDNDTALKLAPAFLPETKMKSGYDSRPESHWWYLCEGSELVKIKHPDLPKEDAMIIEIRSKNVATCCPPSTRPDGQLIKWYGDIEPATASYEYLRSRVNALAATVILLDYWKEGVRNSITLALAGAFAYCGKDRAEAIDFIETLCKAANDEEVDGRLKNVIDTYTKLKDNKNITGFPTLKELIGDKAATELKQLLGFHALVDADKMKAASEIIADEAHDYYRFAFCSEDGIFSTRFGRFVAKSAFKEPFNDEALTQLRCFSLEARKTKKDGTMYVLEKRGMPALYKDFSPIAYQRLMERLPHSAPISGISVEGNRFFITGSNGIWEIVDGNALVKSDRICVKSGDKFEVIVDGAFTHPFKIFNGIRNIVEKFNWVNQSIDPSLFTLYVMYLSIWECVGQKIHSIVTGGTGSGKTALTCLVATPTSNEGDPIYKGYGLIPHSMRAKSDSTISGIQKLLRNYPHCCLVLDEGEMDQEGARIGKILNFLRGAAGGGEAKLRGGNWHNDESYPPTILSGIHIYIDEVDSSRFLLFELLPPADEMPPVMPELHKLRALRNGTVTGLLTSLIPHIPAIKAYIEGHVTNNRTENLYLPLMAILNTVLRHHLKDGTADLIEARIAELAQATRDSIKQDCSGKQRVLEIVNHIVRIESEDTSLLAYANKHAVIDLWRTFGPYQAWVRLAPDNGPLVAMRYEFLYQIKYDIQWTKTLKSEHGFNAWCTKNQLGEKSMFSAGAKSNRSVVLNSGIFKDTEESLVKQAVDDLL